MGGQPEKSFASLFKKPRQAARPDCLSYPHPFFDAKGPARHFVNKFDGPTFDNYQRTKADLPLELKDAPMASPMSRRGFLQSASTTGVGASLAVSAVSVSTPEASRAGLFKHRCQEAWLSGTLTGAQALVETLKLEGTGCVFGIPGAQQNELWDAMKALGQPYLLTAHEQSAAMMADGYARVTGQVGVVCIVPGPGITNALTGIGEALLDSVPMVVLAGDVARGEKYRPFQVHCFDQAALLRPVTKQVYSACSVEQLPSLLRQAFATARSGEPGPVGVVVPYPLLSLAHHYCESALPCVPMPFDACRADQAKRWLARTARVGLYVGKGCENARDQVRELAERLQAPVASSVSGKGMLPDDHPLAVGWGYGPQATPCAEKIFSKVDLVLALGVKFSEVSTGFYSLPEKAQLIHVDAKAENMGGVMKTNLCVHADVKMFLDHVLTDLPCRPANDKLTSKIGKLKNIDWKKNHKPAVCKRVDPMLLVQSLNRHAACDALIFTDATKTEHWAAETFSIQGGRRYCNPVDNQVMGWSVPASIGAQKAYPCRQVITLIGDGCLMMTGFELSTAAREGLPIKVFVLDDQAYGYMQALQEMAYKRTTATVLANLDYECFAKTMGLAYARLDTNRELDTRIPCLLNDPRPMIIQVNIDYGNRSCRWINAVRERYIDETTTKQKIRMLTRLAGRSLDITPEND